MMRDQLVDGNAVRRNQLHRQAVMAWGKRRRADDIQCVVVDQVHVDGRRAVVFRQPAKDQNPAAFTRHLHGLNHSNRCRRRRHNHVCALTVRQPAHFLDNVGLADVNQRIHIERFGKPQPVRRNIGDKDLICAMNARQTGMNASNWAGPDDQHRVAHPHLPAFLGVQT